jgi:hypothetical protein
MAEGVPNNELREKPRDVRFILAKNALKVRLGDKDTARVMMEIGVKVLEELERVESKINPRRYASFHMLIGSTLRKDEEIDGFDWEGPTSVVETLEKEVAVRGWS